MTHPKGWINRQCTRMEREVQSWPGWMRREFEIRAQEQKASTGSTKVRSNNVEAAEQSLLKKGE